MNIELCTKLGKIYVTPTDWKHIYVTTDHPEYGKTNYLNVRGVDYSASFHMYLWPEEHFHLGRFADEEYKRRDCAFIRRADWLSRGNNNDGASTPTWHVLVDEVTAVVDSWARANPLIRQRAEVKSKESAYLALVKQREEAEALVKRLNAEAFEAERILKFEQSKLRNLAKADALTK